MAAEVFVDTSAWYPIVVAKHPQHRELARALQERVRAGQRVVTTNLVVAETQALLLHRVHRQAALIFARTVREAPNLVVFSTADLEAAAIKGWLERFDDQLFSLADAVSFQVMKSRHIDEALTLDRHFEIAGFSAIPT
ncbi:MAG TPA: PIN domain-containing protein [Gemmatimonadaceae bacterium]|nr:PIN domain-containing protein [Gemmatimonadaceae bacterium]